VVGRRVVVRRLTEMPIELRPNAVGGVRTSAVSKSFQGRFVLHDVDFHIPPGSSASIIGQNGSGKSTMLRLLGGVLSPDAGVVEIAGAPAGSGRSRLVPAGDRMLNWRLSASQNLSFFARLGGISADDLAEVVDLALGALDARPLSSQLVGRCSTGQRRRLMIAAGFVACSPVVLLDEPMEDLDHEGRLAVERICRHWADEGGCVVAAAPEGGGLPASSYTLELKVQGTVGETP
jgi:ABC-2 type transport system ATP-binding protein